MDLRIDHVHAVAMDMDASIELDASLGFGLLCRFEFEFAGKRKQIAYAGSAELVIELAQPRDATDPPGGGARGRPFAMVALDADATIAELKTLGVEITMYRRASSSFTDRTTITKDPSDLEIELRERSRGNVPAYPAWTQLRKDVVGMT
jgi:hypothetical protein